MKRNRKREKELATILMKLDYDRSNIPEPDIRGEWEGTAFAEPVDWAHVADAALDLASHAAAVVRVACAALHEENGRVVKVRT